MSNTMEKRIDYAARQRSVDRTVIPAAMVAGVNFTWLAGSGDTADVAAFLFVFSFQATLAALWIGFRMISAPAQLLVVVLLGVEGVFAARYNQDGLLNLLLQEPGWALVPSLALVLGCRFWSLWFTIDPSYMARAEVEARRVIPVKEDVQFSIWHLMLFTVLVGCLLKIVPWISDAWMALFDWAQMLSIYFAVGSLPSLLAIWAMLGLRMVWLRVLVATLIALVLIWFLEEATVRNEDSVFSFFFLQYIAFLTYLGACRWCGHRLVAWPNVVGIAGSFALTDRWHQRAS